MPPIRFKSFVRHTFRIRSGKASVAVLIVLATMLLLHLGIAISLKGRDDGNKTLPIYKFAGVNSDAIVRAFKLKSPSVVVSQRVESQKSEKVIITDFLLVNPLDVPVTYTGYCLDSCEPRPPVGEINPLFRIKFKKPKEPLWYEVEGIYCGTGLDTLAIRPMEAGRFHVFSETPSYSVQVGVTCKWKRQGIEFEETIWSPVTVCKEPR